MKYLKSHREPTPLHDNTFLKNQNEKLLVIRFSAICLSHDNGFYSIISKKLAGWGCLVCIRESL